jgi:hypothetical protein
MTIPVSPVSNNQTFGAWLTTTNRLTDIISQNTVTADSSNGGSVTTGNSFVNGHFGADYLYVANTLSGGNVSSGGVLRILANVSFTNTTSNSVVILSNGHVGIGNSAPTEILHVTGNTRIDGVLSGTLANFLANATNLTTGTLPTNRLSGTYNISISGTSNNSTNLGGQPASFYTNATNLTTGTLSSDRLPATANIATAVNVGNSTVSVSINSTAVLISSDPIVQQSDIGTDPNQIPLNQFLGTLAYQSDTVAVSNIFSIGTTNFVANGNIGVGNSAPDHRLRVEGDISLSGGIHANGSLGTISQALFSNGTGVYWANVVGGAVLTSNNTANSSFFFPMANTTSGTWSNGVVSDTKLFFVPSTGTLNATIFNSLSDAAEKTNVAEIADGLTKVLALKGVEFDWKDSGFKSAGVIAQDVEVVLPHIVATSDAGVKSVNYSAIIAYLISAIHELEEKVRKLENG